MPAGAAGPKAKAGPGPGSSATQAGSMGWSRRNNSPVLMLSIGGKPAPDLLRVCLSFSHKRSLGKSAETKFKFRNDSRTLLNDPRMLPNTAWEYRYGYLNDLSPVTLGYIREVAPVYDSKITVDITLYDSLLSASVKSSAKNWGLVQSSDIAAAIALKNGFKTAITPSNDIPKKKWIQPNNINDVRYLRDLAVLIDFEVYVTGSPPTLVYRKKAYSAPPKGVLTYWDDPSEYSYVKRFAPKVKSLGPMQAGIAGTDHEKGVGQKETNQDPSIVNLALDQGGNFGSPGTVTLAPKSDVSTPVPSNLNNQALVLAARQQMLDKANQANSSHPLTASITPGDIFIWKGVETQLSGKWYCFEEHSQISGTTSSTEIEWKRNAMGKGGDKLSNQNNSDDGGSPPNVTAIYTAPGGVQAVYTPGTPGPTTSGNPQPVPKR